MFAPFNPQGFDAWHAGLIRNTALREIVRRRRARNSLLDHLQLLNPDYKLGHFVHRMVEVVSRFVNQCEQGRAPHLMIFAPPRHGKSEIVSRALPTWYLGRNPAHEIIAASSGQDLADEFGLYVRNTLNDPLFQDVFPECRIDPASNAVSKVSTTTRGGYRAVGVGGQIVGRGGHLLILDDPVKGAVEAYSATQRKTLYDWYRMNFYTRRAPGAGVIVMHQRWHPDDLAGTLISEMESQLNADNHEGAYWEVVSLPAIAEEDDENRLTGEPLFPERWPLPELNRIKMGMSPEEWAALYQQRPVLQEGGWFKEAWFKTYDAIPANLNWYIGADYAVSTSSYADDTAIVPIGIDHQRNLYIAPDFFLGKLEPLDSVKKTLELAEKYNARYLAADDGNIERVMRPIFREVMRTSNFFLNIHGVKRDTKKHIVAASYHARLQHGAVWFPNNRAFRDQVRLEHLNFIPDADNKKDNFIDAMANACQLLDGMIAPSPDVPLPEIEDPEEARWDRILRAGGDRRRAAKLTRLNGEAYVNS